MGTFSAFFILHFHLVLSAHTHTRNVPVMVRPAWHFTRSSLGRIIYLHENGQCTRRGLNFANRCNYVTLGCSRPVASLSDGAIQAGS